MAEKSKIENNEKTLGQDWQFYIWAFIPLIIGIIITCFFGWKLSFQWDSDGLKNFYDWAKLPLSIMALSIPIAALYATHFRSKQTNLQLKKQEHQIKTQQQQNITYNYFNYLESFKKIKERFEEKLKNEFKKEEEDKLSEIRKERQENPKPIPPNTIFTPIPENNTYNVKITIELNDLYPKLIIGEKDLHKDIQAIINSVNNINDSVQDLKKILIVMFNNYEEIKKIIKKYNIEYTKGKTFLSLHNTHDKWISENILNIFDFYNSVSQYILGYNIIENYRMYSPLFQFKDIYSIINSPKTEKIEILESYISSAIKWMGIFIPINEIESNKEYLKMQVIYIRGNIYNTEISDIIDPMKRTKIEKLYMKYEEYLERENIVLNK